MSFVIIWVHLIWSTKNRQKIITKTLRPEILDHILKNARKKNIYIDQINCTSDHCHALIRLSATQTISNVAFLIKGESSNWINDNGLCSVNFGWQKDYFAVSVSEDRIKFVRNYIKYQQEHHRKKTFREEYDSFMKKYGVHAKSIFFCKLL
jgi:REP element-mobilizing transposase RayT